MANIGKKLWQCFSPSKAKTQNNELDNTKNFLN